MLIRATHEALVAERKIFRFMNAEPSTVVAPEDLILSAEGYENDLGKHDTRARWSREHRGPKSRPKHHTKHPWPASCLS